MKQASIAALALYCAGFCPSTSIAAAIPASEDSYSSRGRLTAATSRAANLRIEPGRAAYVYFNLAEIPATTAAQVRYARLRVYLPSVTTAGALGVYLVSSEWDESLPSSEPTREQSPTATIPAIALRSKRFASVDVTDAVRAWVSDATPNQGFAIVGDAAAKLLLSAKEGSGTGYPAELEIELNPDAGSITSSQLANDLTLAGTTSGTFSGNGAALLGLTAANIAGQLSNSQLANSGFSLSLGAGLSGSGSVSLGGTLSLSNAGVLSLAAGGGVTVSGVAGNVTLGSTATDANTPGGIVARDASGNFSAGKITAEASLELSSGIITQNGVRLIHGYGDSTNFFAGGTAGNFSIAAPADTGIGVGALYSNTTGGFNTAIGYNALSSNTSGHDNVAIGASALLANTAGIANIAIGSGAGRETTGDANICIANFGIAGESGTIRLGTNGTHTTTLLAGNVGISLENPKVPLQVAPSATGRGIAIGNDIGAGGYTALLFDLSAVSGGVAYIQAVKATGSSFGDLILNGNGGNVGIGRTPSGFLLDVNGSIRCVGAVNTSSDARFKQDVRPLESALQKVLALQGVSYEWNRSEYPQKGFADGRQIGFIAQQVEPILPEVVSKDAEGFYSVAYAAVVPVLVEAIKEQEQTLSALKRRLSELEARLPAAEQSIAVSGSTRTDP